MATTIGFIGAGDIGRSIAQLALRHGHRVLIANSRRPETLAGLVGALGQGATAVTATEAAAAEIVVVAIPLAAEASLPAKALAGSIVTDTDNYYPPRDGDARPVLSRVGPASAEPGAFLR